MADSDNSKAKIATLPDCDLRAIINSTVIDGRYWLESSWARDELWRRHGKRVKACVAEMIGR